MDQEKENKLRCSRCKSGNVYPRVREGTLVCRSCLNVEYINPNKEVKKDPSEENKKESE